MGSRKSLPKNQQLYSRPTKAYQQHMSKRMPDMKAPDMPDPKKTRIQNIGIAVVAIILIVLCSVFVSPWLGLVPFVLVTLYGIFFMRRMNKKQLELLAYYQKIGMNKKMFFKQMERHGLNDKNRVMYNRMWDVTAKKADLKLTFMEKLMGYGQASKL